MSLEKGELPEAVRARGDRLDRMGAAAAQLQLSPARRGHCWHVQREEFNIQTKPTASGKEISGTAGSLWTIFSFKRLFLSRGIRWSHSHMLYSKDSATEEAGMVGKVAASREGGV